MNGTYGYYGYKRDIKHPNGYYEQPTYNDLYNKYYKITWNKSTEKIRQVFYKIVTVVFEKSPFKIFQQPMLYTWMYVAMFVSVLLSEKMRKYWIVFIPIIVLYAICFASPVNGDIRYMLPIMSTGLLYLGFIFRDKVKEGEVNDE